MAPKQFRVLAIIAAFNEADIVGPVIAHLVAEGVSVYLIDHHSTDQTRTIAETFLGRGLVGVETFPETATPGTPATFTWRALLERKQQLATELDADWFIHHDADEFRESPWSGIRLVESIRYVHEAGYNAIDFELLNFVPTDDGFARDGDPRERMRYFEPAAPWDKLQVKCWRRTAAPVDLVSSGGHDVRFPDRRVFPVRFLLRHYPIRSQQHGIQKVFIERRPRLDSAERELGWHIQYDGVTAGDSFVKTSDQLTEFDAQRVRVDLAVRHRDIEALAAEVVRDPGLLPPSPPPDAVVAAVREAIVRRDRQIAEAQSVNSSLQFTIVSCQSEVESLRAEVARLSATLAEVQSRLEAARDTNLALEAQLDGERERREFAESAGRELKAHIEWLRQTQRGLQDRLDGMCASKTWRWTSPLRRVVAWFLHA
jgi:hypothetical protein